MRTSCFAIDMSRRFPERDTINTRNQVVSATEALCYVAKQKRTRRGTHIVNPAIFEQ